MMKRALASGLYLGKWKYLKYPRSFYMSSLPTHYH